MTFLYNIVIYSVRFLLNFIVPFNKKIALFVNGRKETFSNIQSIISKNDQVFWFHCASLGEFEQGRPVIERLKKENAKYKIVLTFFSPSGFEVQKNYKFADVVTYLPLDTSKNAKKFIEIVHPEIAFFVKYEFWPNYLKELKKQQIETLLISGIFRENQSFFKSYGGWMRNSLKAFSYFFVQNKESKELLESIGFENCSISGDTRFDRVSEITKQNNNLDFIEKFKQDQYTLVAGSTWTKDEELLVNYINNVLQKDEKIIIAPHNINQKEIDILTNQLKVSYTLYSDKEKNYDAQVFIVDTIGILTKIYSYADSAYVGGGFKNGIHNVLEPATFGIPLVIGPVFEKFQEAKDLVQLGGCEVITNQETFDRHLKKLYSNDSFRKKTGNITGKYIEDNIGATNIILEYVSNKL